MPDTANGWGAGKQIFFPGGVGQPDSEGLTVGPDGALYVTTERDNANNTFALNSVLRFDPTAAGTTLTPTAAVEPHGRLPRADRPRRQQGQGQPRLRGRHLRARHVPRAERLRRPVDRLGVLPERLPGSRRRPVLRGAGERRQAVRLRPERRRHVPPRRRRRHGHGPRDGRPVRRRPPADLGAVRQHVLGVVDAAEGRRDRRDRPRRRVRRGRPACRT